MTQRAVFSILVILSKTTHVDNTLGVSRAYQFVCQASLSFIDPFNNQIMVLCLKRVNLFDTCGDEMPFCLLIFRTDNLLLKSDYRKQ